MTFFFFIPQAASCADEHTILSITKLAQLQTKITCGIHTHTHTHTHTLTDELI